MNKETRDFLNATPSTTIEQAAQQIIITHTKTHVLQLERSLRKLDQALYNNALKRLTLTELYAAITYAKTLLCDEVENESNQC